MKQPLTKRKQAWARQFKPDVIRGTPLNPNAANEMRYYQALERMIDRMTADVEKALRRLFETEPAEQYFEAVGMDASIASQARILTNKLTEKYQALFTQESKPLAQSVATMADKSSSGALHSSIQQLSGGLSLPTTTLQGPLGDILSATVTENVGLIRSIPAKYLEGVQGAVMRSITTGNGLADLVPYLQKHKGITLRRARMIAQDQTRKAFNNLNKARMQKVGIQKFEWLHTGGSAHPRKLHQQLSGKIFSFDNLPVIDENSGERGIPGQAINCRCRMVPVLDLGGDGKE